MKNTVSFFRGTVIQEIDRSGFMETDVAKCLFYVATGKIIRLPSSLGGQVGEGLESGKLGD